jgi:hypothetical protein
MIDLAIECERNGWRLLDYRRETVWPRHEDYPTKIYGWPANKARGRSRGKRDLAEVTALMLHTTDASGMKAERGLGIPCHAFIPADEAITLCHHADRLTYHGHSANRFTYGLEISGRCDFDAPSQITRARLLIAWWRQERLAAFPGAPCYIMAHRQSHWSRVRDPGPVIWRELGEWAIDELGMLEGPVVGDGSPIPDDWRR